MIFIDSNIPMYLVGSAHPNRDRARVLVEQSVLEGRSIITDAEVYQEILHRYAAIGRSDAISPAFAVLDGLVDRVCPITHEDVHAARNHLLSIKSLSARDAIHVAVMQRSGCAEILSFDAGFDQVPAMRRVA